MPERPPPNPVPQSSIPGYRPAPYLTRGNKWLLASFFFIPTISYIWLKRLEAKSRQENKIMEEEGRKNWIQTERQRLASKDLSVTVGRSGGGV
ncbi:hypothetical protein B0A52_02124 [Exophiala mesophila]|uniref:Uncharacterized protein n=1 Tax=Exophiala mesophila TaxID=212818 RepID=A0A438NEY7_EXOME|nr:hypothetical protein B0A52_02124 [Exophiala mesophila]